MPQQIALKDSYLESRIYGARTVTSITIVVALLGLILARYYSLQVTEYEVYRTQSDRNRVQLQPLPPKRGLIYDRNGVLLADNRPSYLLSIVVERVADLDATLAEVSSLLPVSETDVANFRKKLPRRRPYEAVPLRFKLTEEERARLAVNSYRLPGVVVDAQLLRYYPHGELFSHALAASMSARCWSWMKPTTGARSTWARSGSKSTMKTFCTVTSATRTWRPTPTGG